MKWHGQSKVVVNMICSCLTVSRILRVLCTKLRLEGDFHFEALAKATPGYVGADLSALTSAAGIIAVKRIFQQISEGTLTLPDVLPDRVGGHDQEVDTMAVDGLTLQQDPEDAQIQTQPPSSFSSLLTFPGPSGSIGQFLNAHPDPLTEEQLAPLCITFGDFQDALKKVQPSSKREGFATVPDVAWSDIGALHGIREELQMAIVQPIKRPELFNAVGIEAACGVLLWGPPGCGKTLLAKAVANESRASFISVKGPELLNKVRACASGVNFVPDQGCSMWARANERSDRSSHVLVHRHPVLSFLTNWMHLCLVEMIAS